MRIGIFVLMLVGAASADVVLTRTSSIEGIASMPDTQTIAVALPLGGTRRLAVTDVTGIYFDDAVRYDGLRARLSALGIAADLVTGGTGTETRPEGYRGQASSGGTRVMSPVSGTLPHTELEASYQSVKRDPAMAGLLSAFVPTLGHVYAGEGGSGTGFFVGELVFVAAAVLSGKAAAATDSSDDEVILTVVSTACWAVAAITKICECGDAVNAANRYNRSLRERLGLQIGLQPLRGEAAFGMACRF